MLLALDTETTGLDLHYGCKPFLVTTCTDQGVVYWEWDVDPKTRQPVIPSGDIEEIQDRINEAEELVGQNIKFDIAALAQIGIKWLREWHDKTQDTLFGGHLLASGEPHDLTSMALKYLRIDIQPYEDRMEAIVKPCRTLAKREMPTWKIIKEGLYPSAKRNEKSEEADKLWKWDTWLPRAIAKHKGLPVGKCSVVNLRASSYDVRIDRQSKWGNPFVIGKDGDRDEVILKYQQWLPKQKELMDSLKELNGKRLGCHCDPLPCHGHVLQNLVESKLTHPYWNTTKEYANTDSGTTLELWKVIKRLIEQRDLWPMYLHSRKLIRSIVEMEARGVPYNEHRLAELYDRFVGEIQVSTKTCIALSGGKVTKLPKAGTTKEMRQLFFNDWKMPIVSKSKKTGEPSIDKKTLNQWKNTLDPNSVQGKFINNLLIVRSRNTACGYADSYRKYGVVDEVKSIKPKVEVDPEWYRVFPFVNATGTDTLRFTSSGPNEHQISKQDEANMRYAFGPQPGREWWSLDYSNIELRIPAYESGESEMIALFEKPDEPPYFGSQHMLISHILWPKEFDACYSKFEQTGNEGDLFNKRYKATIYQWVKNGDFAVTYGAIEESGTADAAYHLKGAQAKIKARFSKIDELNQLQIAYAREHGIVWTMPAEGIGAYPIQVPRTEWGDIRPTTPLNYHSQGTAMLCMRIAMVRCQDYLDTLPGHFMIMQIHDELVFDFPKSRKPGGNLSKVLRLKYLMELSGKDIGVPLRVDYSYHPHNWAKSEHVAVEALAV